MFIIVVAVLIWMLIDYCILNIIYICTSWICLSEIQSFSSLQGVFFLFCSVYFWTTGSYSQSCSELLPMVCKGSCSAVDQTHSSGTQPSELTLACLEVLNGEECDEKQEGSTFLRHWQRSMVDCSIVSCFQSPVLSHSCFPSDSFTLHYARCSVSLSLP